MPETNDNTRPVVDTIEIRLARLEMIAEIHRQVEKVRDDLMLEIRQHQTMLTGHHLLIHDFETRVPPLFESYKALLVRLDAMQNALLPLQEHYEYETAQERKYRAWRERGFNLVGRVLVALLAGAGGVSVMAEVIRVLTGT